MANFLNLTILRGGNYGLLTDKYLLADHIETSYADGLRFSVMNPIVWFLSGRMAMGSCYIKETYLPLFKLLFSPVATNRFPLKCVVRINNSHRIVFEFN